MTTPTSVKVLNPTLLEMVHNFLKKFNFYFLAFFFSFAFTEALISAEEEEGIPIYVSYDQTYVAPGEVSRPPTKQPQEALIRLQQSAFKQFTDTLKLIDTEASNFDKESNSLEIEQIEIGIRITAEGKVAIVSGSTEGSLKYVLRRKNKQGGKNEFGQ